MICCNITVITIYVECNPKKIFPSCETYLFATYGTVVPTSTAQINAQVYMSDDGDLADDADLPRISWSTHQLTAAKLALGYSDCIVSILESIHSIQVRDDKIQTPSFPALVRSRQNSIHFCHVIWISTISVFPLPPIESKANQSEPRFASIFDGPTKLFYPCCDRPSQGRRRC